MINAWNKRKTVTIEYLTSISHVNNFLKYEPLACSYGFEDLMAAHLYIVI